MASSALGSQSIALLQLPSGTLIDFAGTVEPSGWLLCDGRELLKTSPTYASLFAAVGIAYGETNGSGGAGTTHFRLPDFRGRFARYNDNMGTARGAAGEDVGPRNADKSQGEATKQPTNPFSVSTTGDKNQFNTNQVAHSHGTSLTLVGASTATTYQATAAGAIQYSPNQRAAGTSTSNSGISTNSISWNSANFSTSGSVSGGGDTETRPKNLACNKLIKI